MQYQILVNLIKTGLVRTTSLLTILISLAACSQGVRVVEMLPPVGENTSLSRLTTDAEGKVYLSWVETKADISSLYYATLAENKWSAEKLIGQGADWFVNWADFPFL